MTITPVHPYHHNGLTQLYAPGVGPNGVIIHIDHPIVYLTQPTNTPSWTTVDNAVMCSLDSLDVLCKKLATGSFNEKAIRTVASELRAVLAVAAPEVSAAPERILVQIVHSSSTGEK